MEREILGAICRDGNETGREILGVYNLPTGEGKEQTTDERDAKGTGEGTLCSF